MGDVKDVADLRYSRNLGGFWRMKSMVIVNNFFFVDFGYFLDFLDFCRFYIFFRELEDFLDLGFRMFWDFGDFKNLKDF